MRGNDTPQTRLFYHISYDQVIPENHPLRHIRRVVDQALSEMDGLFQRMYAQMGRPSIAPERLLRALLIEVLYSIRSDRQLVERLRFDLLVKWFVGLEIDEDGWDASTFSRNRDRLMAYDVSRKFFERVLAEAHRRRLLSEKHFTVDGTLIQAWASMKSIRKIDDDENDPPAAGGRNEPRDFHGESRTNDTHRSTTDPEARLFKKSKGQAAQPCFMGHVMTENRNGLVVDAELTLATGTAERDVAVSMTKCLPPGSTLGADKGYDARETIAKVRDQNVTPHFAANVYENRTSAIDGRTTRHPGYVMSQRRRKLVEEVFGWLKTIGNFRKARWIGRERIEWRYLLGLAAYNLVRLTNLGPPDMRVA